MSTRTAKLSEKKAETSIVLIVFGGVLCEVRAYIVTVTQNESGTRKAISWSVYKNISSQCNLTAQIEPQFQNVVNFNNLFKIRSLHLLIFFAWPLHLPLIDQA